MWRSSAWMNHFLNLNQTMKAAVKLLPWNYLSGSIYPQKEWKCIICFAFWWLKATLFWIVKGKKQLTNKKTLAAPWQLQLVFIIGLFLITSFFFFSQRSSKKYDLWGVQEKTQQFMWKRVKEQQIFFFIKHIYSSFSINRYLQIQITSAFSSHKMDNYLKIYELTKTCSFLSVFSALACTHYIK